MLDNFTFRRRKKAPLTYNKHENNVKNGALRMMWLNRTGPNELDKAKTMRNFSVSENPAFLEIFKKLKKTYMQILYCLNIRVH